MVGCRGARRVGGCARQLMRVVGVVRMVQSQTRVASTSLNGKWEFWVAVGNYGGLGGAMTLSGFSHALWDRGRLGKAMVVS